MIDSEVAAASLLSPYPSFRHMLDQVAPMHPDRLEQIRQSLYIHGSRGIHELARELGASPATIRRDLQRLEDEGLVQRTHGGATLADSSSVELAFATRESQSLLAKRAIGNEAYARLRAHTSIFLDASTTVLQLARRLRTTPLALTVFTSSLAVAETLFGVDQIQLYMLGGRVRHENRCVVGPMAERAIDGLWFDQLFLGGSAIQPDVTIATPDGDEASLNAAMLERATERILMVDSSKFGRHATHRVAPLSAVSMIVTDDALAEPWHATLRQLSLSVTMAVAGEVPREGAAA